MWICILCEQDTAARPVFIVQSNSSLLALLCAISARVLCVVVVHRVGIAAVGLRAIWHLTLHCHPDHFQPALLKLLCFSSKVVDGLGLREAEVGGRVCGLGAVIHRIAQEGDSTLGLHVLRSSVEIEHQTLLLRDDAPHLLPRFVLLTVLQEAAHDAAACELSCLDLHGGELV